MALIEVLKWDAAPKVFAFKYPNCELNTKSQLIVNESQEAVLVKEGRFYGPLGPGRHTLDTKNFPFLTKFITKLITGGVSPFTAEVWFVNKTIPLNVKWGTTDPIQIEDPKYHIMLPVRAFGQYGVQITNAQKFLAKMVGRMPVFVEKTLTDYFRGMIITRAKDCIGSYLIDQSVSVLQLASRLNAISGFLQEKLTADVDDYGLRIVSFTVNSISTDEKEPSVVQLKKALAKRAEMDIMGYTYQQEKSFDVMGKAASNTGSGVGATLMNAGMGMGIGVGMGGPMGAVLGTMATNLNVSPSSPPKESPAQKVTCGKCGHAASKGAKFCPNCGESLGGCPKCGATIPDGVRFCPECGYKLRKNCMTCNADLPTGVKFCPNCGTKAE